MRVLQEDEGRWRGRLFCGTCVRAFCMDGVGGFVRHGIRELDRIDGASGSDGGV